MGNDCIQVAASVIVRVDPRYFRPTEVESLMGDPRKAKLGWVPVITVQQMCAEMVAVDQAEARRHSLLKSHCYSVKVSIELCQQTLISLYS